MKKNFPPRLFNLLLTLPIIILALVVLNFSCNKANNQNEDFSVVSKTEKVIAMSDKEAQKVAFSEHLSPGEKFLLWINKLNFILNQTPDINSAQRQLVLDLKQNISEDIFSGISSRDQFMNIFGNAWLLKAEKSFGRELFIVFFTSISLDFVEKNSSGTTNLVVPKCKCSAISDYCATDYRCNANIDCEQSSFGCGFLGLFICDGRCFYNPN